MLKCYTHTQQKPDDEQEQEDLPYLLAEVRDTVELFTELYAVTCLGTKAITALSGT